MSSPAPVNVKQTNFTQQIKQTLDGLQATAPGFFDLNQTYTPKYTDQNLRTLAQTLFGSANAPGELQTMNAAQSFSRGSDVADIYRYGRPGYDALMQSNPGLAQSLGMANAEGAAAFAPDSTLSQLQNTAQNELALGSQLSPQEETAIREASRSGFSDRGMGMGNQSLGAELLARDQYAQQRLGQRIGYATSVEQLAGADRNQLNQLAGINASIYDPSQQVLGRGSSSAAGLLGGGVNPLSLSGALQTQSLFSPNQGADAFNTNVNAQGAAAIANANNSASSTNGWIGAGASILGSIAIAY